ncbi:MAG TPA: hypothetical protein VGS41_16075, partial [Chthonomonadales bacterium]|nr:hypothetical protein [Chthonomonadales bacterium]
RNLRGAWRRLRPLPGIALLLLLAGPWHYLVWRAGGRDAGGLTWFQQYIVEQHINRFRGGDVVHNMPLPTYLLYFLIGFFPWSCFTVAAFRAAGSERQGTISRSRVRFLLVWFWTIFLFFTAGAAKLPTYIAPAYPAAALLVGKWLDAVVAGSERLQGSLRSLRRGAFGAACVGALLFAPAACASSFIVHRLSIPPPVVSLALFAAGILFAGSALSWLAAWTRNGAAARTIGTLTATMFALDGLLATRGYALADRDITGPYQRAAAFATNDARAGVPVVYYHIIPRRPSMNFYAGYSPLERKEMPLLPFLKTHLPPGSATADVVTTRQALDADLAPEIAAAGLPPPVILDKEGPRKLQWVVARIALHTRGSP